MRMCSRSGFDATVRKAVKDRAQTPASHTGLPVLLRLCACEWLDGKRFGDNSSVMEQDDPDKISEKAPIINTI